MSDVLSGVCFEGLGPAAQKDRLTAGKRAVSGDDVSLGLRAGSWHRFSGAGSWHRFSGAGSSRPILPPIVAVLQLVLAIGQPFQIEPGKRNLADVVFDTIGGGAAFIHHGDGSIRKNGQTRVPPSSLLNQPGHRPRLPFVVADPHGHIQTVFGASRIGEQQAVFRRAISFSRIADQARLTAFPVFRLDQGWVGPRLTPGFTAVLAQGNHAMAAVADIEHEGAIHQLDYLRFGVVTDYFASRLPCLSMVITENGPIIGRSEEHTS